MVEIDAVTYETDSVFHSLGLPNADDLLLRSESLMAIGKIIADHGLKQREVGALLGMNRTDVAALVRGRINHFSSEGLACALHDLNADIVGVEVMQSERAP